MARKVANGWLAEWRVGYGRGAQRRTKVLGTKSAAVAYEEEQRSRLRRGEYVDPKDALVPFADVAADLLADVEDDNTRASYGYRLAHVLPVLGHVPVGHVTDAHIDDLVRALKRAGLADSHRRGILLMAAMVLRRAHARNLAARPPKVPLPEVRRREIVVITTGQAQALVAAAPEHGRAAVVLGLGCGLRQGEVLGLTVARAEFLRQRVRVEEQIDPMRRGQRKPPKTAASRRTVPMPGWVADELGEHLRRWPADADDFLFRTARGRAWSRGSFNDVVWRPARRAAGLPDSREYGFHITRHFYVSALIDAGLHPAQIQRLVGHASISETMDTYGHLFPHADDAPRRALDGLFASRDEPGTTASTRTAPDLRKHVVLPCTRLTGRLVRPTSPDRPRRGCFRRSEAVSRVRCRAGP